MPHYAAIEPNGNGLMIASYKSFKVVSVDQDLEESMDEDRPEKIKGNLTVGGAHCAYVHIYVCLLCLPSKIRYGFQKGIIAAFS